MIVVTLVSKRRWIPEPNVVYTLNVPSRFSSWVIVRQHTNPLGCSAERLLLLCRDR